MTRGRYRWALAVVAVSAFMITMDNTVVAIAGATIRDDLRLTDSELGWVTVGYILMFSCLMIAGGRLTDIYGCRVTFVSGMIIFTGASLCCGLAKSDAVLILARVVQGSGSALALPATLVMVTVGRTEKQTSIGQIIYMVAAALAMAAGPPVGGLIVENVHWGWIFLINVPVGIGVILLGLLVLNGRHNLSGTRVDLPGVLISATMMFALAYASHVVRELGWSDPAVLGVLALAGIAAVCFVIVESWAPDPMIDLSFFRNRVFTGGIATSMLWGVGFNGVMFYASLFMQDVLGFKPSTAALAYLPSAAVMLVMTPVSYWLAPKVGSRLVVGGGMVLMAAGMAAFTLLRQGDQYPDLMPGILLTSVGSALTMPLAMFVLKSVPEERVGVAGGILNVVREISAGLGIAALGVVVETLKKSALEAGEGPAEAFRQGASVGLLTGAGLVLLGAVIASLTLPRKRREPAPTAVPVPEPAAAEPVEVPLAAVRAGAPVAPGKPDVPAQPYEPRARRTSWRRQPVTAGVSPRNGTPVQRRGLRWPPPPPGWYKPYDPDDLDVPEPGDTADSRRRRYRGDAW